MKNFASSSVYHWKILISIFLAFICYLNTGRVTVICGSIISCNIRCSTIQFNIFNFDILRTAMFS